MSMARVFDTIFPNRIHRVDFVVRFIVCIALTDLWTKHLPMSPSVSAAPRIILWWLGAIFVGIYWLFFVFLPRLRDAAMSQWWLLFALFPIFNLALALILAIRSPSSDVRAAERVDTFWT